MKNNLSDDEKNIIWSVIKKYEEKHGIVEHPYNYPRFRTKPTTSGGYNFWCMACNEIHHIPDVDNVRFSNTVFNGNLFKPTFFIKNSKQPQYFITKTNKNLCCYSIIDGVVNYGDSCSHILGGVSLELEEYENWKTININYIPKRCVMPNCNNKVIEGSNFCEEH